MAERADPDGPMTSIYLVLQQLPFAISKVCEGHNFSYMRVFFPKGFSVEEVTNAQLSLSQPDLPQVSWSGCSRWFGRPLWLAGKCSFHMKTYV